MTTEKKPKLKLTGLWKKRIEGSGIEFFTGYLGSAQIEIWPNRYKTADNHPDYIMYLTEQFKKDKPKTDSETPAFDDKSLKNNDFPF